MVVEGDLGKVTLGIERAIAGSYIADCSTPTPWETKRRFDLCIAIFLELRGDLKWSRMRILDALPTYLRTKLDGGPYNPQADAERGMWTERIDPLARDRGLIVNVNGQPMDAGSGAPLIVRP